RAPRGLCAVRDQVCWAWGEPGAGPSLPVYADAFLGEELGLPGGIVEAPVALEAVRLRAPELPREGRELLERAVGAEHVLDDAETRVLRCRGKSYLDL